MKIFHLPNAVAGLPDSALVPTSKTYRFAQDKPYINSNEAQTFVIDTNPDTASNQTINPSWNAGLKTVNITLWLSEITLVDDLEGDSVNVEVEYVCENEPTTGRVIVWPTIQRADYVEFRSRSTAILDLAEKTLSFPTITLNTFWPAGVATLNITLNLDERTAKIKGSRMHVTIELVEFDNTPNFDFLEIGGRPIAITPATATATATVP